MYAEIIVDSSPSFDRIWWILRAVALTGPAWAWFMIFSCEIVCPMRLTFLICYFKSALVAREEFFEGRSAFHDLVVFVKSYISYSELDSAGRSDGSSVSYYRFCNCVFSNT